ncbi:MAG: hypothetical protein ACJAT7_002649 [Psychromonas sp.]|jgi:hypothetical protein|uniref:hypothetical protein n=1 Tax=Psychromonas sp. TaxID=1884585 RepID=UPI0039E35171
MKITPNIKNMAVYTFIYGLFTSALLFSALIDYSNRALLVIMSLTKFVNVVRFIFIARKNIFFINDQLCINGSLVSVSHKNKWLAFLWLDSIEYESSPWKKSSMGTLSHYMFSKEQWTLLKSNTEDDVVAT